MPNTPGLPQYRPILALVLGVVAVLLLGLLLSLFHYEQLSKVMRNDGSKLFERVVQQVGRELDNVYRPPMQALNLLNGRFVLQQARLFAARVMAEAGNRTPDQVRVAFRLTLARSPSPGEAAAAMDLVEQHGLAALGRVLFNTNEFLWLP